MPQRRSEQLLRAGDDATRPPSPVSNVDLAARPAPKACERSGGPRGLQRAGRRAGWVGATPAARPWPAGMPVCTPLRALTAAAARAGRCQRGATSEGRAGLRGAWEGGCERPFAVDERWLGLWRAQMELLAALLRGGTTGAGARVAASLAGRQYVASIRLPALRLMARLGRLAEERTAGAAGPGAGSCVARAGGRLAGVRRRWDAGELPGAA